MFFSVVNVNAYTGVVFVHGNGDYRETGAVGYWEEDNSLPLTVEAALPSNYRVFQVACDFSTFLWNEDASICITKQVNEFVDAFHIDDLIIIAHSAGGVNVRWVLSNPTWHDSFPPFIKKVKKVLSISSPHSGTELADQVLELYSFPNFVKWMLGLSTDSLYQFQKNWMNFLNDHWLLGVNQALAYPVPFYTIVATDVVASPFLSQSYCSGYRYQAFLKLTQSYFNECSDGYVSCKSQSSGGIFYGYDVNLTDEGQTLSHVQSAHACFGFENNILHFIME